MTSSQSRYSLAAATAGQESLFVGDEWRFLSESALQPGRPKRDLSKTALLGIGILLGTGAVNPALAASIAGSVPAFVVSGQPLKAAKRFEVLSPAEQIIAIRSLLGLNVLELASILRVQRPTVYSWQSGTATPHYDNSSRLRYINELALRWSRTCSEPIGDWVRRPLDDGGRTLVLLLSAESIDETIIVQAFGCLKTKLEEESKDFIGVRERARRFGYKDRSKAKQETSLDRETLL
jgi:hypothetical protein